MSRYTILQNRAIRLFDELVLLRAQAKRTPPTERPQINQRAREIHDDLKLTLAQQRSGLPT
jgi:hypothetical protein